MWAYRSFRCKLILWRCKQFHVLGWKNKEYSLKMFSSSIANFTWSDRNFVQFHCSSSYRNDWCPSVDIASSFLKSSRKLICYIANEKQSQSYLTASFQAFSSRHFGDVSDTNCQGKKFVRTTWPKTHRPREIVRSGDRQNLKERWLHSRYSAMLLA